MRLFYEASSAIAVRVDSRWACLCGAFGKCSAEACVRSWREFTLRIPPRGASGSLALTRLLRAAYRREVKEAIAARLWAADGCWPSMQVDNYQ